MQYNIGHLRLFMAVCAQGTYTQAAELLGIDQPSVSRQMRILQENLGVKLIETSYFGISLTPEGERLYKLAPQILQKIDNLPEEIQGVKEKLEGELTVIAWENFGQYLISEYHEEFIQTYPGIVLNVHTEEPRSLLYAGQLSGAFVGITSLPQPQDSDYIWKKIGSINYHPYAHPSYLKKYGHPQTLSDLDHHKIIRYQWSHKFSNYANDILSNPLLYQGRKERKPRQYVAITDDINHCKLMINKGAGIGTLPRFLAHDTNLVQLLDDEFDPNNCIKVPVNLVYPSYGARNAITKAFINFFLKKTKPSQESMWIQEKG